MEGRYACPDCEFTLPGELALQIINASQGDAEMWPNAVMCTNHPDYPREMRWVPHKEAGCLV